MRWTGRRRRVAACAILGAGVVVWYWARHHSPRAPLPPPPPAAVRPLLGVTVVLDPGHGGEDPGAVSRYGVEAAYTYRAAVEIGAALREQGATVVYTVRSRALDPALAASEPPLQIPTDAALAINSEPIRARHSPRQLWLRAAAARRAWHARTGPDPAHRVFFLSLHLDDEGSPDIRGSLVCVDRRRHAPAFGQALARALVQDGLARLGSAGDDHPGLSLRSLGVLNPDYNPVPESALLEMTTLSNFDDALRAADPQWRTQMAARIARALVSVRQERR